MRRAAWSSRCSRCPQRISSYADECSCLQALLPCVQTRPDASDAHARTHAVCTLACAHTRAFTLARAYARTRPHGDAHMFAEARVEFRVATLAHARSRTHAFSQGTCLELVFDPFRVLLARVPADADVHGAEISSASRPGATVGAERASRDGRGHRSSCFESSGLFRKGGESNRGCNYGFEEQVRGVAAGVRVLSRSSSLRFTSAGVNVGMAAAVARVQQATASAGDRASCARY
eukprot:3290362-Pleurochrysis_carterae.AAC.2